MPFIRSIKKIFRPARAVVLMYHRIAEPQMDPWQLAVTRENFREHLKILASTVKVVSTDQLIQNIQNKTLDTDCFCITSDDGYPVGDIDAGQARAMSESPVPHKCNAAGNHNARQLAAAIKQRVRNTGNTVWNVYASQV